MAEEVVDSLSAASGTRFVDGTLGLGGHAEMLLDRLPDATLLGIDRDDQALAAARTRLERFGERCHLARGSFSQMAQYAKKIGWRGVDGVLLDLGISSLQLDDPRRGFAFRNDGPLDMRMDRRAELTAARLLNTASEQALTRIFREYGEERRGRRLAQAIVERRSSKLWERTAELKDLVDQVLGRGRRSLPPATKCFQALRIAVNTELDELPAGLRAAVNLLRNDGRLAVIAFHSLEDRIVKRFIRGEAATCICPPGFPVCTCGKRPTLEILTRKPRRPTATEVEDNRRAASARLRVARRINRQQNEPI